MVHIRDLRRIRKSMPLALAKQIAGQQQVRLSLTLSQHTRQGYR